MYLLFWFPRVCKSAIVAAKCQLVNGLPLAKVAHVLQNHRKMLTAPIKIVLLELFQKRIISNWNVLTNARFSKESNLLCTGKGDHTHCQVSALTGKQKFIFFNMRQTLHFPMYQDKCKTRKIFIRSATWPMTRSILPFSPWIPQLRDNRCEV